MKLQLGDILKKLKGTQKQGAHKKLVLVPEVVLSFAVLLVIGYAVWVLQGALKTVYNYYFVDPGAKTVQSTRVNFENYSQAEERIRKAESYAEEKLDLRNPFLEIEKRQQEEE